jgi:3'(2'), 5'-bisphosphate nucleotidase
LLAADGSVTDLEGGPFRYGKPGFRNGHFVARGRG